MGVRHAGSVGTSTHYESERIEVPVIATISVVAPLSRSEAITIAGVTPRPTDLI